MRNESLARIWLKRAKSNLQMAKAGKVFEDIAKKVFDWARKIIEDDKKGKMTTNSKTTL